MRPSGVYDLMRTAGRKRALQLKISHRSFTALLKPSLAPPLNEPAGYQTGLEQQICRRDRRSVPPEETSSALSLR